MSASKQSSKSFGFIHNESMSNLAITTLHVHPPRCTWCEFECYCDIENISVAHIFVISVINSEYKPQDCVYYIQYLRVEYNKCLGIDLFKHINVDTEYTATFSVHTGSEEWLPAMDHLQRSLNHTEIVFTDFSGKATQAAYLGALKDILVHLNKELHTPQTEKKANPHVSQRKKK